MFRIEALKRLGELVFPNALELVSSGPTWLQAYSDMHAKYVNYEYYYSGKVLEEYADPKRPQDSEKKYPLKINLCREWAHMLSSYIFGQWTDQVVQFQVDRRPMRSGDIADEEENRCSSMEDVLRTQWMLNENDSQADSASIDNVVYGGTVIKTFWDNIEQELRDEWVHPDYFMPRWHPLNINKLLETIISFVIPKLDAVEIFNLTSYQAKQLPPEVIVWERWTDKEFILMVDKIEVKRGPNPLGLNPYTYIPRIRSQADNYGYFGLSTLEDTMALQDEVNARAADIGDGIAYSSHPIRVLVNYSGDDLEVGPDATWNLGMGFGGRKPEATALNVKTNYGEGMEFVERIERMGRGATHLPSIAFGEDEGSQRSGTTLLLRFLPLTQEVRRMRLHWARGLRQKAIKTLELAAMHPEYFGGIDYTADDLKGRVIKVGFAPILPKDVSEKVTEWVQRIESGFGTPFEAYEDLGHPDPEMAAEDALEYMERVAKIENITKGAVNVGRAENAGNDSAAKGGNQQARKGNASS